MRRTVPRFWCAANHTWSHGGAPQLAAVQDVPAFAPGMVNRATSRSARLSQPAVGLRLTCRTNTKFGSRDIQPSSWK
jgi:hypothetical protein